MFNPKATQLSLRDVVRRGFICYRKCVAVRLIKVSWQTISLKYVRERANEPNWKRIEKNSWDFYASRERRVLRRCFSQMSKYFRSKRVQIWRFKFDYLLAGYQQHFRGARMGFRGDQRTNRLRYGQRAVELSDVGGLVRRSQQSVSVSATDGAR